MKVGINVTPIIWSITLGWIMILTVSYLTRDPLCQNKINKLETRIAELDAFNQGNLADAQMCIEREAKLMEKLK